MGNYVLVNIKPIKHDLRVILYVMILTTYWLVNGMEEIVALEIKQYALIAFA